MGTEANESKEAKESEKIEGVRFKLDKRTFAFGAKVSELDLARSPMKYDDLYTLAFESRENKRKIYEKAMNAALDNLLMWEVVARGEGFDTQVIMAAGDKTYPVLDKETGIIDLVRPHGIKVIDTRKG